MTPAPVLRLLKIDGLFGGLVDFRASTEQQIGPHHATEQPVYGAAALDAANHADIRSIYFGDNVADEVFRDSKRIRHFRRHFHRCHFLVPAALGKKAADIFQLSERMWQTTPALSLKFAEKFFAQCRTVSFLDCTVPYTWNAA